MDSDLNFTQDFLNLIRKIRRLDRIEEILKDSLLYQAADVSGVTLLHYSAQYNNEMLTKYLLNKGCDVNIQDSKGNTPLMIAVEKNSGAVMITLLSAGADMFILNNNNKSALHMLSEQRTMMIYHIRFFLQHLAKICSTSEEVAKKLHDARCPLYQAILLNDFKVIEYMIERGSSVNCAHPVRKYTAVHIAVKNEDLLSLTVLLKHGADVNALDNTSTSPIYYLHENGKEHSCTKMEILKALMNQGAVMTSCTWEGIFQVYDVLTKGNREAVRILIESRLDFNVKDTYYEKTVLHYLATNLEADVVEELKLQAGKFDVDVRDKFGVTPLLVAVYNGNVSMVKFLLKQGAKTDLKDYFYDTTPLYYAYERVKEGFEERFRQCGELLLHYNADPQLIARNETGEVTILDAALKVGNIDRIKPVVAHLAMIEKRGTRITKRIWEKIHSHDKLKEYYEKCRRLLKEKITGRVVLFDLISSNSRKMAKYLNNENISYILRNENYMRKIMKDRYYLSVLNKRCCEGKIFMKLKTIAARIICTIFENCIDKQHLIIDKVIGYLNDQSLGNLCQLYHQLGSHRRRTVKSGNNELVSKIRQRKDSKKKYKKRILNENENNLVKK